MNSPQFGFNRKRRKKRALLDGNLVSETLVTEQEDLLSYKLSKTTLSYFVSFRPRQCSRVYT